MQITICDRKRALLSGTGRCLFIWPFQVQDDGRATPLSPLMAMAKPNHSPRHALTPIGDVHGRGVSKKSDKDLTRLSGENRAVVSAKAIPAAKQLPFGV